MLQSHSLDRANTLSWFEPKGQVGYLMKSVVEKEESTDGKLRLRDETYL